MPAATGKMRPNAKVSSSCPIRFGEPGCTEFLLSGLVWCGVDMRVGESRFANDRGEFQIQFTRSGKQQQDQQRQTRYREVEDQVHAASDPHHVGQPRGNLGPHHEQRCNPETQQDHKYVPGPRAQPGEVQDYERGQQGYQNRLCEYHLVSFAMIRSNRMLSDPESFWPFCCEYSE